MWLQLRIGENATGISYCLLERLVQIICKKDGGYKQERETENWFTLTNLIVHW